MKRTNQTRRALRLSGETVRKLSTLSEGQLRQVAGGGGIDTVIDSLDNFCYEWSVYCPA